MRRRLSASGLLLVAPAIWLPAGCLPGGCAPAAAAERAAGSIEIAMDRTTAAGGVGDHLTLGSTVANRGAGSSGPLLAHLDMVSHRNDVYVDPEDWSGSRTVELEPLAAGERRALSWTVHNVDEGQFDLYVVLLPTGPPGQGSLAVSQAVSLTVTGRRTVDPGNSLGVVLAVPLLLAALAAAGRLRRRGRRWS